MNRILLVCTTLMSLAVSLLGQSFTNLNFESARVIISADIGGNQFITTENALPGWSAFSGTNQLSLIEYNFNPLLSSIGPVDLYSSDNYVLSGNFSVVLGAGGSISQTGFVPSGTKSLLFDASSPYLLISLGGQNLSYAPISTGTGSYGGSYSTYAADVSDFAGQMETLTFSGAGVLDDIQFSLEMIPEPSALWLMLLGGGVWLYVLRTRKNRRPA